MISFVVPAHNEEAALGATLAAINESARAAGFEFEVIVVDDASTDATARIARRHGARVVTVNHRQIAATRNSGGRAALGERIFFVDADTLVNPRAVAASMRAMDRGAVGGGAPVKVEGPVPLYISLIALVGVVPAKLGGFCGGAFMFCTREAFQATGGFDERMFWGEDGAMGLALKRLGPFVVIWNRVLTSGRRFRTMSGFDVIALGLRILARPIKMMTQRASVQNVWYESNRTGDDKLPDSLASKVSHGIVLVVVLIVLIEPVLYFVPWSETPITTPLGKLRFVRSFFLSHLGLIFWPLLGILSWNLLRQKLSREWMRSLGVIAFCGWQAWGSTQTAARVWAHLVQWIIG